MKRKIILIIALFLSGCREKVKCPYPIKGSGGDLRVFAMGHKQLLEHAESYKKYTESYMRDVRNISSCLAEDKPNLLVFPEDAGLIAAFIGERGKEARNADNSFSAFGALLSAYDKQVNYYINKYPSLPLGRYLTLALTHTVWKAFYTTFSKIARDYGVFVESSVNVAEVEERSDPELLSIFGDEGDEYVYLAKTTDVYNMAVVFGPDGSIIDIVKKVYLVPVERDLLSLTHNSLEKFQVVELPFAKVGIVISKDAWMPDVLDRLHIMGANLILQPEAFSGWGYDETGGWLPDVFKESSWNHTQKYPGFIYSIVPMLVGNLFEISFDGQTHISKISESSDELLGFVGQEPTTGFLSVEKWVMDDPVISNPSLNLLQRREILNERALELKQGSGSPYENAYLPQVSVADLDLSHPDGQTDSFFLVHPSANYQRFPRFHFSQSTTFVIWSELTKDGEDIYLEKIESGNINNPVKLNTSIKATYPSIVVAQNGNIIVSWEEKVEGGNKSSVQVKVSTDGGKNFSFREITSPDFNSWQPSLYARGNTVAISWVDWRNGREDIYFSKSEDGGINFTPPVEVESTKKTRDDQQDNSFRPSLSISDDGTVLLAWTDFRNYSWDIYAAIFPSQGTKFSEAFRVDDGGNLQERLHTDPFVEYHPQGYFLVAWTDLRERQPHTSVRITKVYPDKTTETSQKISGDFPAWLPSISTFPPDLTAVAFQAVLNGKITSCVSISSNGEPFSAPDCTCAEQNYAYSPSIKMISQNSYLLLFQTINNRKGAIALKLCER